jgi:hypothetical protein
MVLGRFASNTSFEYTYNTSSNVHNTTTYNIGGLGYNLATATNTVNTVFICGYDCSNGSVFFGAMNPIDLSGNTLFYVPINNIAGNTTSSTNSDTVIPIIMPYCQNSNDSWSIMTSATVPVAFTPTVKYFFP